MLSKFGKNFFINVHPTNINKVISESITVCNEMFILLKKQKQMNTIYSSDYRDVKNLEEEKSRTKPVTKMKPHSNIISIHLQIFKNQ